MDLQEITWKSILQPTAVLFEETQYGWSIGRFLANSGKKAEHTKRQLRLVDIGFMRLRNPVLPSDLYIFQGFSFRRSEHADAPVHG